MSLFRKNDDSIRYMLRLTDCAPLFHRCSKVLLFALFFALSRLIAGEFQTIDGEIFIRTNSGDTVKLSAVDIYLFQENAIQAHLEEKRRAAQPIDDFFKGRLIQRKQTWESIVAKGNALAANKKSGPQLNEDELTAYNKELEANINARLNAETKFENTRAAAEWTHSSLYLFRELPAPLQATTSDADGKFTFQVPDGSYVVAATTRRQVGKTTEFYSWMVRIAIGGNKKMLLANNNLSSTESPDSLIKTPKDEAVIYKVMGDQGIHDIETNIEKLKNEPVEPPSVSQATTPRPSTKPTPFRGFGKSALER